MKNILIIANARRSGGLSGSDNIYEELGKYWTADINDMVDIEFYPFIICYIYRTLLGIYRAIKDKRTYDLVYSGSDFFMDSMPGFIYRLKGNKWVAGFYLYAPRENRIYYWSQKIAYWLIKKYADVVCITNDSMKWGFMDKRTVSVNGGVNLDLTCFSEEKKVYDAVFCGRIHPTKGIKEMIEIWAKVIVGNPKATLALIGDGDLGTQYIYQEMKRLNVSKENILVMGYRAEERFDIYKKSKMVLYPSTADHFSMAPVEAMACGCPAVAFNLDCMNFIKPRGMFLVADEEEFAKVILSLIESCDDKNGHYLSASLRAYNWARSWDWKEKVKVISKGIEDGLK